MVQIKRRSRRSSSEVVVNVRRSYVESRFGQIHLTTAYPSGGGFNEHTPIVCLHHSGGSGRFFAPVLPELGRDRSVFAPDLPGHGTSDAVNGRLTVAELAGAVGDFIRGQRLHCVDLIGYQLGGLVAAEIAISCPQLIRRVLMWGVPAYAAQERGKLIQGVPCVGASEDGSDVSDEWNRTLEHRGKDTSIGALRDDFGDRLHAGMTGVQAYISMIEYSASQRLPLMRQPSLVLRLNDEYAEHAGRTRMSLTRGALMDLREHGQGILSATPQHFAAVAREFFDR